MAKELPVEKDTIISEVIRLHPKARSIFVKYGMGCLGCMGALDETIEGGAKMHGINAERLIAELNAIISVTEGAA